MGSAGVGFAPDHDRLQRALAFVGVGDAHLRGLADDDGLRRQPHFRQRLHEPCGARAIRLLVIGEDDVDGGSQLTLLELGYQGQSDGQKTLHVAGAAPIQSIIAFHDFERITAPDLAVHRNHVGVP